MTVSLRSCGWRAWSCLAPRDAPCNGLAVRGLLSGTGLLHRTDGLAFERAVHSLVCSVLVRSPGKDALMLNSEPHSPDVEPGGRSDWRSPCFFQRRKLCWSTSARSRRSDMCCGVRDSPMNGTRFPDCEPSCRSVSVSYTHLRAHETRHDLVCRL